MFYFIICILAIGLTCYNYWMWTWLHRKYLTVMPGPKRYPIVGVIEDIMNPSPDAVFLSDRRRARNYPNLYSYWLFHIEFVGVVNPEDTEKVLGHMKHVDKSSKYSLLHGWLATGLLTSSGEKWQSRRKILTPAFHFSILQEFVNIFNKETEHLVNVLNERCHKPYIDVVKPITEFTLYAIGETSFGVKLKNEPLIKDYKRAVYNFGEKLAFRIVKPWWIDSIFWMTQTGRDYFRSLRILHKFSTNVINERQKVFKDKGSETYSYSQRKKLAMLDLLLKAKEDGANIDDEGIREEVDTFIFEGHDTTAMAICSTLLILANEPDIQKEILQEINEVLGEDANKMPNYNDLSELKYMERCIKECLRIYPSVPFIARQCSEDFISRDGYLIPKGVNIHLYIYDLHRNPDVWEDPEKFDPDRFLPDNVAQRHPFAYVPFSAGPRNCIGQKYAILEIKAALCGILRKFKLVAVDKREDIKFKLDLVLRPIGEVRVKFVPRKSTNKM